MRSASHHERPARAFLALLFGASAVAVCALVLTLGRRPGASSPDRELVVYCAAGVRAAVEAGLADYQEQYGWRASLHLGPSGAIEAQAKLSGRGDLIIPAATKPFLSRMQREGLVREVLPVATLRLVIASAAPEAPPLKVADLLASRAAFGICNVEAAAGERTKRSLEAVGLWEQVSAAATASFPTVTELAEAVRDGGRLEAGLIWSTTAKQFDLAFSSAPELSESRTEIAVGVLESTSNPQAALRLARFLTAQDRGQDRFAEHHYECLGGDRWAETPRLVLFSGTVNRNAITDSLDEFQRREGCEVTTVFDGCGTLVGTMKAGASPDCYFACDVSYVDQVSDEFDQALEVSENRMVIVVKPGNPKEIRGLVDLAREDVLVGLCDADLTALGSLTARLLREEAIYERVIETGARTVTTGDLLVAQMIAGDKLDAAIVYRANCVDATGDLELVAIPHPMAKAIQPFSIHRESDNPLLAKRLRDHLTSDLSRERFERHGFQWRIRASGTR